MALRMTDRVVDGVDVLDIEGRIVLGEESNAFREKVKSLLAAGKKKIVLNLAQVSYMTAPASAPSLLLSTALAPRAPR